MGTSVLLVFLTPLMALYAAVENAFSLLGFDFFEKLSQWTAENSDKLLNFRLRECTFFNLFSVHSIQ